MNDSTADLEFEERQVMAFLAPLADIAPAMRPSRSTVARPRLRRPVLVLAVVAVLGAGAAVATTVSHDPIPVTITEQDGTEHPGTLCPTPPGPHGPGFTENNPNGIRGRQPGEECPTKMVPTNGDDGSKNRGDRIKPGSKKDGTP